MLRTPRVFVTPALVWANVAVLALMVLWGANLLMPDSDVLVNWGANYGPRTLAGQWWRLLTCAFLHIGVIHLAFNMWALSAVGRMVERLVGNAGFAILYLVSGLAGSVASVAWNPHVLSAGASGAVFGVFGALLGFILRRRDTIPPVVFRELRNSTLACLGYNLLFSFSVPAIDKAAHLGGLVAGFLCGLVMSQPLELATPMRRSIRNLAAAFVGAVALLGMIRLLPPPPPPERPPVDSVAEFHRFVALETEVREALHAAAKKLAAGELDAAAYADVLERDVLPRWRKARECLDRIGPDAETTPPLGRLKQYQALQEEAWQLEIEAIRNDDAAKLAAAKQKHRAAAETMAVTNK